MEKKTVGTITILAIALLSIGLLCRFDTEPTFTSEIPFAETKITWLCESAMTNYSCNSFVRLDDETIQVNPQVEDIREFGRVTEFQSKQNLVQVNFVTEANVIRAGINYTFLVTCSDGDTVEDFNATVNPQFQTFDRAAELVVLFKDSAPFVLTGLLVIIFVLGTLIFWYGRVA